MGTVASVSGEWTAAEAGRHAAQVLGLGPAACGAWWRETTSEQLRSATVTVTDAATTYGTAFGYTLAHDEPKKKIHIGITQPVAGVNYVYPYRSGQ